MRLGMVEQQPDFADWPASRALRLWILAALLIVPQCVLFGPSLIGQKVLLPLDILRSRGIWGPAPNLEAPGPPQDRILEDLVFELEVERRYAVAAVRSGRIPLWNPLIYCGTPFLASNHSSVFYPLRVIDYLLPGTLAIAWVQLLKSVLAGLGAYLFARRVMRASYWAAAVGAALWPLCGFLILWAGFTISQVGAHLPWVLLATDASIRRPRSLAPLALALTVAVALVSGHASVAGHVLIASGLFALFRIADLHGLAQAGRRRGLGAFAGVVVGWLLGFLLSAPQTLPTLDYMQESWRIQKRQEGRVETPAVGLKALPAVAMPYWHGSTQRQTIYLIQSSNRPEGPPSAYAGFLALCVLAPLGFASRRRWRFQLFWIALGTLGLAQVLGLPLSDRLFELPLLNTLRNNRFTLVTAWSIVALAVAGLDALVRREVRWRPLGWLLGGACAWIALQAWIARAAPPEALARVEQDLRQGRTYAAPLENLAGLAAVQRWFADMHAGYALLALAGAAIGLMLMTRLARTKSFAVVLGLAAIAECTVQSYDVNPQCDPSLDYPRVELFEKLRALPPGRVAAASNVLPADLNQLHGLSEARGYDAADPARMVDLLLLFPQPNSQPPREYAAVQAWMPKLPSPLADMLGLRYFIAYSTREPTHHVLDDGSWYVQEVASALPRAWIPARAERVNDRQERLALLASPAFDPRAVVYLESEEPLAALGATGAGEARLVLDEPERVVLELEVRDAGWLVLADRWAPGWKAWVDGVERPVRIANHALRAVQVDPGTRRVEFRYEPQSWRNGLLAAAAALVMGLGFALWARSGSAFTGTP